MYNQSLNYGQDRPQKNLSAMSLAVLDAYLGSNYFSDYGQTLYARPTPARQYQDTAKSTWYYKVNGNNIENNVVDSRRSAGLNVNRQRVEQSNAQRGRVRYKLKRIGERMRKVVAAKFIFPLAATELSSIPLIYVLRVAPS